MKNTFKQLDDNPLTNMALAVMSANALWFAYWAWSMDAYKMATYAWAYPQHLSK